MRDRFTIGYLNPFKNVGYLSDTQKGVTDAVVEAGCNVIYVADFLPYYSEEYTHHYFHLAMELTAKIGADAYVVPIGSIANYIKDKTNWTVPDIIKFLSPDRTILIEDDYEGFRSIIKDNTKGMRDLVLHLIEECGYRKICFVAGPVGSRGSMEREKVYYEEMAAHNLPVTDEMFCRGNFFGTCDDEIDHLITVNPDVEAIVCASDRIAMTAYRVMKKRGLTPGEDIAVTGFDDVPEVAHAKPPLSTVRLSSYDMGYAAGVEALRLCRGEDQQTRILGSEFIKRASCGKGSVYAQKEKVHPVAMDERTDEEAIASDNRQWAITQLISDALTHSENETKAMTAMLESMRKTGINYAWVFELAEPISFFQTNNLPISDDIYLKAQVNGDRIDVFEKGIVMDIHSLARMFMSHEPLQDEMRFNNKGYTVGGLLSGKEMQGIMVLGPSMLRSMEIVRVFYEVAFGLKHLKMIKQHEELIALLNKSNIELSAESEHDPLTGLYNRRGFMHHMERQLKIYASDADNSYSAAIFFMDLDWLKRINDNYGHDEGDFAIKCTANILQDIFDNGIVGRLGGDEFLGIYYFKDDDSNPDSIMNAIDEYVRVFNDNKKVPYPLGISVGYCLFDIDSHTVQNLSGYIEDADAMLYENKQIRKVQR